MLIGFFALVAFGGVSGFEEQHALCLHSFSVLVNGTPVGFFNNYCGLR